MDTVTTALHCVNCLYDFDIDLIRQVIRCPRCGAKKEVILRELELHPTADELLDDCEESVCPTKQDLLPSILQEAQSLVHGARNETYGYPWEDYARTVGAFKALMGDKSISDMTAEDGMLFMVCVKLSRQINLPKRDNLVDAAGYLECINWSLETKIAETSERS